VALFNRGSVIDNFFIVNPKGKHEDNQLGFWINFEEFGVEVQKRGKIHYYGPLLGDFLYLHRRKRDPGLQIWKNSCTQHFTFSKI
jgi:hypothetical protein